MGELSGQPLAVLAVLAMLAGCFGGSDPDAPERPELGPADLLFFSGNGCTAVSAEASADAQAVAQRLPTGFRPVTGFLGDATVRVVLVHCPDGRVADVSVALEDELNFWYLEALVTPPAWAPDTPAKPAAYVLAFHSLDPLVLTFFPQFNVTVEPGAATFSSEGGQAVGVDGSVFLSRLPGDAVPYEGRDVRRFLTLANETVAVWDGRESVRQGVVHHTAVFLAEADAGTLWGRLVGTQALAQGFMASNYWYGPGQIYWVAPTDGTP